MKKDKMEDMSWQYPHKGMNVKDIQKSFRANREYYLSKDQYSATTNDNFWACALAVRDRIIERWIQSQQRYHKKNLKRVYYLSIEFLIGRLLGNYMVNLGLDRQTEKAMRELGFDLEELREQERDAGLGNGGLGRLAACFLDSMATLGIPAHGYGIRFDYGIFHQKIKDGYQVELPDEWLQFGSPWEFARPEYAVNVQFFGHTQQYRDDAGRECFRWVDTHDVLAVPYDYPIPGYKNDVVNTLRLWSAKSTEEFDFEYFNDGDYEKAVHQKILSENISKVLYPSDSMQRGKVLRLKQEYFFVAAAITDIIRRFHSETKDIRALPDQAVIQLNDTHPSLAVPELMRILLDKYRLEWDEAWDIVERTFAYTNHTLMPEALECWPVDILGELLPRHLQIIYEINARFLNDVSNRYPGDMERTGRMSIIAEGEPKQVRMANLAIVGSSSVNGVSKLHTDLLKSKMFKDFDEFSPGKINAKTNGITQRRWLLKANPDLADLISREISDKWAIDLEHLKELDRLKTNTAFQEKWRQVKAENKKVLAAYIQRKNGISVDPQSIFDVQVKRIHEYKRQLLFGFYMISQYLRLKNNPAEFRVPRTFIVGGKAAPGYDMAKLVIKFINSIADVVNRDKTVQDRMRVVFLSNYRVSLAEKIFPAADLSEQISTAGMEASGTGNMKFMLNGALTIGTLDGANIEMSELVGDDNIFIFGLRAHEIDELRWTGYSPHAYIERNGMLKEILRLIEGNYFSAYSPGLFQPILDSIWGGDPFFVCADFEDYFNKQDEVSEVFLNREDWTRRSIVNVSQAGFFSSDRTIAEYARDIWKVETQFKKK